MESTIQQALNQAFNNQDQGEIAVLCQNSPLDEVLEFAHADDNKAMFVVKYLNDYKQIQALAIKLCERWEKTDTGPEFEWMAGWCELVVDKMPEPYRSWQTEFIADSKSGDKLAWICKWVRRVNPSVQNVRITSN